MKKKAIITYLLAVALLLSACVYRIPQKTENSSNPALRESESTPTHSDTPLSPNPSDHPSLDDTTATFLADEFMQALYGEIYTVDLCCYQQLTVCVNFEQITGMALISCDVSAYDVDIPAAVMGNPVIFIADSAFEGIKNLREVTIPESVLLIGADAFSGCKDLISITLPSHLIYIGQCAFADCLLLRTITIPAGVTEIHDRAFMFSGLTEALVSEDVKSINESSFSYCENLTTVVLPAGLISIGELAFSNCPKLTDITIPESVQYIGFRAFFETPGPKEVRVTPHLDCHYYAFDGVEALETVIVEDGVERIPFALPNCVENLQLSHDMTELPSELLVDTQVKFLEVYEGVTKLGFNVFGNKVLESVILPSTLTDIEDDIFWGENFDGSVSSEYCLAPVKEVFFRGTGEQCLQELKDQVAETDATLYFYSETEPTEEGNFWHYVDGKPVIW